MNKVQTNKSLLQKINARYHFELKQLKRKKFCLKIKLMLTIVLPIIILALFIKVTRTFIQIKLRQLFTRPFHDSESAKPVKQPVPVKLTPVEKEILQTEPVPKEK